MSEEVSELTYANWGAIEGNEYLTPYDKVKISWINGIGNSLQKCQDSATLIQKIFNGAKVHFFHNQTDGIYYDLARAARHFYGWECKEAQELAGHLKELLKTAEKVIHIAHSHGGIITSLAAQHLTPEERSRIDVVLFGSPALIPEGIYKSIRHYVSDRDLIPYYCHPDLYRAIAKQAEIDGVVVLTGDPCVYVDHAFASSTYQNALKEYATEYLANEAKENTWFNYFKRTLTRFFS